jgi:hypothetical protein
LLDCVLREELSCSTRRQREDRPAALCVPDQQVGPEARECVLWVPPGARASSGPRRFLSRVFHRGQLLFARLQDLDLRHLVCLRGVGSASRPPGPPVPRRLLGLRGPLLGSFGLAGVVSRPGWGFLILFACSPAEASGSRWWSRCAIPGRGPAPPSACPCRGLLAGALSFWLVPLCAIPWCGPGPPSPCLCLGLLALGSGQFFR